MKIKFQATWGATLSTMLMLLILVAMGSWQVERLEWKTNFLAEISAQMEKPPVPLPEKMDVLSDWQYRRVTLAGRFLHDKGFLLKPRTLDGVNGYHMVVPFERASGGIVFVNRGWISEALMDKAGYPAGLLQIEGVVQIPRKTRWTPENRPDKKDWYWADIPAMAQSAGLGAVAPVIVNVADRQPGVWPAGGKVQLDIPNDHRQYAIFWYTMALVLLVIYVLRALVKVEEKNGSL